MSKPTPISGFPEWLPPQRMIEQYVIEKVRATFELYGFAPLETRSVEPLDQLLRKGETSKEVYVLRRLQEEDGQAKSGDALGLHFDLTVPFARFVLENSG
jgi:histidyl-tRNA synthetase